MKSLLLIISLSGVSTFLHADSACNVLDLNDYKEIILHKQLSDPLLYKLRADAYFYAPAEKNCYVTVKVRPAKDYYEYWINYLFDPKGELVNIEPSSGPDLMTCNNDKKRNVGYFSEVLAKKRAENPSFPSAMKNPKKPYLFKFFCNMDYVETAQDDKSKPLLYRTWVFDKNDNIVEYRDIQRYSKIYKEE